MKERKRTKEVVKVLKLQVPAGKATPAPPVGSTLGPHGVSAPQFVQQFNDTTRNMESGLIVPVVISVYKDKSFSFIVKTPPAAVLIKKAAGIDKGAAVPHKETVATLTQEQLRRIAEEKMKDLNAHDVDNAMRIIAGTARSMGVKIAT